MEMVSGKQPDNGIIYTNSSGEIAFAIEYDKFCYTKGYEDKDIKAEESKNKIGFEYEEGYNFKELYPSFC